MTTEELEHRMPSLRRVALLTAEAFYGRNAEMAEDVAQECCLRLWLRCAALQADRLDGLVRVMARNLCVSEFRKLSHMVPNEPPERPHEATPAASAIESDNQRILAEAIGKLPMAWQRLLKMQAETEMSTRQMAMVLGIKPASVSVMLSSAWRRLYEMLKEQIIR